MKKTAPCLIFTLLTIAACARNPVTGERELMLVSEAQEIEMGRQAAQQIPAELGLVDDRDIANRLQRVGLQMARASERPNLPWEFHVVDSHVVNAFAIPGGFIYFTRGILAHMNSEAEMAGVLGHEIGHVTARHSAQQLSRAQLAGLGLGLGMIFVPEVRPFGDVLQGGLGLLFLKFGRDDEREADRLGVRYSIGVGYDPRQMAGFFAVLNRLRGEDASVVPTWLSTHPDPADREQNILELTREMAPVPGNLRVEEEAFKRSLEGLVFGENPREGFMDGNVFKDPELRFRISFPSGWRVQNTRQTVYAGSDRAGFQMTAARVQGNVNPQAHASRVFQRARLQAGPGRAVSLEGFPAFVVAFRQASSAGVIDGEAAFIRDGQTMYELFAFTSPERYRGMRNTFLQIFESFSRLRDPRDLNVQPQRITLYRVPRSMPAREALRASGVVAEQLESLAVVNHVALDETVPAGTILKSVTRPAIRTPTQ